MKFNRFISIIIAYLLIALPIYSADVFADYFNVTRYSGENNINGFVKREDTLNIEVEAQLDEDSDITADQVFIENNPFSSQFCNSPGCTALNGNFKCSCISPSLEWKDAFAFDVKLFSDNDQEKESVPVEIKVDDIAPNINITNVAKSGEVVSVEFNVKDSAYIEDNYDFCSGIKRIEFWDGTSSKYQSQIEIDKKGICSHEERVLLPIPNSGLIQIKAYDWLEHESSVISTDFEIDVSSPQINTNSFRIESTEGAVIDEFLGSGTYNFVVEIIEKSNINTGNSFVDLSGFGGSAHLPATSCQRIYGDTHKCIWTDAISVQGAFSASAEITVEDVFGNKDTKTTPVEAYGMDTVAPVISSIQTGLIYDGKSYIGKRMINISVLFEESGSGFNEKNAYLTLRELSPDLYPSPIQADQCTEINDAVWKCTWFNITPTVTTGSPEIYVVPPTSDDAGNSVRGSEIFYIDVNSPQPKGDVEIVAIGATEPKDYIAVSDDLYISANATDESGVTAYADVCSIKAMPDCDKLEANCTKENFEWECLWELRSISGPFEDAQLNFTFYDSAMNPSDTITKEIDVLGIEANMTPDYWTAEVVAHQPPRLDRQTVEVYPQRMWFDVELTGVQDTSTLSIGIDDCTGDTGYIENQFIMNNEAGSTHPYIIIEFKALDVSGLDELNFTCPLNIISLTPDNQVSQTETEYVNITVGFFNQPLGEASSSLEDEIDDAKNWLYDWYEIVHELNKYIKLAQSLCNIKKTWNNIKNIFKLVLDALWTVELTQTEIAEMTDPVYIANQGTDEAAEGFEEGLGYFCDIINCQVDPNFADETENKFLIGMETWGKWAEDKGYTDEGIKGLNSQDSIISASLTACIPGILSGIERAIQIQCQYVSCLQNAPTTGVTASFCRELKEYGFCKYIVGEIFNTFSFTAYYDYYIDIIKDIYADPLVWLDILSVKLCDFIYTKKGSAFVKHTLYRVCELTKAAGLAESFQDDLDAFTAVLEGDFGYNGYNYCADVEDFEED